MAIGIQMPALSPTTEEGMLARWLGGEADAVAPRGTPASWPQVRRDRTNASPFALRLARQHGIDLEIIVGSGSDGRVVKADLLGRGVNDSALATGASPIPPTPTDIPHRQDNLSEPRQAIARSRAAFKQQIPHIYLTQEIRLDALLELRLRLNEALSPRVELSIDDLLIKALARALVEVPACNASFAGDRLVRYDRVDISVAIAGADGLVSPVIVDASDLTLSAIATAVKDLAMRAREGRLTPEERCGGTASLSSLAMFGIKQFSAMITPPQAMILAIGAGERRPCLVGDALAVATMINVTGSFDQRVVDGADGARLMATFAQLVEEPGALLV